MICWALRKFDGLKRSCCTKVSFGRKGVTKDEFIQTLGEQFGDRSFVAWASSLLVMAWLPMQPTDDTRAKYSRSLVNTIPHVQSPVAPQDTQIGIKFAHAQMPKKRSQEKHEESTYHHYQDQGRPNTCRGGHDSSMFACSVKHHMVSVVSRRTRLPSNLLRLLGVFLWCELQSASRGSLLRVETMTNVGPWTAPKMTTCWCFDHSTCGCFVREL